MVIATVNFAGMLPKVPYNSFDGRRQMSLVVSITAFKTSKFFAFSNVTREPQDLSSKSYIVYNLWTRTHYLHITNKTEVNITGQIHSCYPKIVTCTDLHSR